MRPQTTGEGMQAAGALSEWILDMFRPIELEHFRRTGRVLYVYVGEYVKLVKHVSDCTNQPVGGPLTFMGLKAEPSTDPQVVYCI